jgi:hypothetical protein
MTVKLTGVVTLALLAAVLFTTGCEDEDIPTFAPGPYLFSNLSVTKATLPPIGSRLVAGSVVNLRFSVAYTLDQSGYQNRANLGMFVNVFGRTATDSVVNIGGFPDKLLSLTNASGTLRDSVSFTLPAGVRTLTMETFLDTLPFANPVMALDSQNWPVQ